MASHVRSSRSTCSSRNINKSPPNSGSFLHFHHVALFRLKIGEKNAHVIKVQKAGQKCKKLGSTCALSSQSVYLGNIKWPKFLPRTSRLLLVGRFFLLYKENNQKKCNTAWRNCGFGIICFYCFHIRFSLPFSRRFISSNRAYTHYEWVLSMRYLYFDVNRSQ